MNGASEEELRRREIEDLLPWHAAGQLSRRDSQRVEDALARDPELAQRFELVREELGAAVHLNETLGSPSPKAMDKLFAKIDAEPERRPGFFAGLAARLSDFVAGLSPRTLAWSAAAAALVVILQAGVIAAVMLAPQQPQGHVYQTAGQGHGEGTQVLVRFRPEATSAEITGFLDRNDAKIVDGPAGGLYTLRIGETRLREAKRSELVKRLQKDKAVDLVLPGGR
jgi:hypothetical protein